MCCMTINGVLYGYLRCHRWGRRPLIVVRVYDRGNLAWSAITTVSVFVALVCSFPLVSTIFWRLVRDGACPTRSSTVTSLFKAQNEHSLWWMGSWRPCIRLSLHMYTWYIRLPRKAFAQNNKTYQNGVLFGR